MRKLFYFASLLTVMGCSEASAMAYGLISMPDGSTAVIARGFIQRNETARLLSFLRLASASGMPRTLIISSPGGNLVSAVHLGETVRRLGLQTSVGYVTVNSSGERVLTSGLCGSACVFVLMGGVRREIRPGSVVGVHSPQLSVVSGGRRYNVDPATSQQAVRASEPILRSYARHMGVSPSVISVAHAVPHHSARVLTRSELNRYGLVTGGARGAVRRASTRQAMRRRAG
jgi:hypothetical protein